jgi:hypothetical protein
MTPGEPTLIGIIAMLATLVAYIAFGFDVPRLAG